MIRLGLRLTLRGGREAALRLIVTIAAIGLGVGLLLAALAGMNAINAQNARTAWLNTGEHPGVDSGPGSAIPAGHGAGSPLWWRSTTDYFGNKAIDRIDVAATGSDSAVPPGLSHLPGSGQFYASPALSRLLHTTSAAELGGRYPDTEVGIIGPSALPSPNSLIIVIGHTPAQLSGVPGASRVTSINTSVGHGGQHGWDSNKLQIILAVGALALLFPVLVFIGTAARLSAARREQRFAAIRLVGATPRQVSVISAVEATVTALGGVVAGFGAYFLLRPFLTDINFTGQPFAPGDLSLNGTDILLVVIGIPIAAAAVARMAMRRVQISPLGVSRRVTPRAPRPYGLVPLAAGIGELAYFAAIGTPKGAGAQILAYFTAFLLILTGLVMAGPWLTMLGARLLARRTGRPAVLIAGRRLADDPRAAFRAVGGLIIAIFVTSVSVGVMTTVHDYHSVTSGTAASDSLIDQFVPEPAGGGTVRTPPVASNLISQLGSTPGVTGITVLHSPPDAVQGQMIVGNTLALCSQIVRTPAIGHCPPGAQVVWLTGNLDSHAITSRSSVAHRVWRAADISPAQLHAYPTRGIVVGTNGSRSAVERTRTALEVAFPQQIPPLTLSEISGANAQTVTELQQLTNIVILVSLVVAACSLAITVTGGVVDRKRPFSLLRLTGVPVKVLRGVVTLEAGVPLLAIALIAGTLGFLGAGLVLRSQLGETLQPPEFEYYLLVGGGLLASFGIIASTFPLIERITGPDVARNE